MTLPRNVVVQDPLAGFRWWAMSEIYKGHGLTDVPLYVPNVNDCVIDDNDVQWRVTSVDNISKLSTLRIMDSSVAAQTIQGITQINRLAPYQQMMRAFLDASVFPYTMNLDTQWIVPGEASWLKVFSGINVSPNGTVVSQVFDSTGSFVGENVPLVPIDPTNPNLSIPLGFNCSTALDDSSVVSVVVYGADGDVMEQRGFLVKNTNAIRGLGQNQKYITSVVLVSDLLDPTLHNVINAPADIPISGGNFQAQLNYTDGSTELISVGGNKCKLFGLDGFNPTMPGVLSGLTLVYYLSVNEGAINISNPNVKSVSTPYQIRAVKNPLMYTFKVFVVPVFNTVTNRYDNDYYLCSLDRLKFVKLLKNQYSITMVNGGQLDNGQYTNSQEMVITVDMNSVFPIGYAGFLLPEAVTIKYGISHGVGWILDYRNDSTLTYGKGVYGTFSLVGEHVFGVQCGMTSLTDWLQLLWGPIHAIFDSRLMASAPAPTHMKFLYDGIYSDWLPVETHWNITQANFGVDFKINGTICIVWGILLPDGITYGTLGVSPLPMRSMF
jgi:hypothetical protein